MIKEKNEWSKVNYYNIIYQLNPGVTVWSVMCTLFSLQPTDTIVDIPKCEGTRVYALEYSSFFVFGFLYFLLSILYSPVSSRFPNSTCSRRGSTMKSSSSQNHGREGSQIRCMRSGMSSSQQSKRCHAAKQGYYLLSVCCLYIFILFVVLGTEG